MKYYVFAALASLGLAQSATHNYITDINGQRVDAGGVVTNDHQRTEILQNLNGQRVPVEQTEERVLRQDGNTKVTERIVRKYDRNGGLASTDRLVVEDQTRPNGSTRRVTAYRSDVNGRMSEVERQTTEMEKQGGVTKTQAVIERPTINGGFQTVEKRSGVTETSATGSREDQTVYALSENGGYVIRSREVKDITQTGDKTTERTAIYQPFGSSAQLQLTEQNVATTTKRPDGSETVEVNMYGSSWSGRATDNQSAPQLREQDVIVRTPGPGGSLIESLSVRRPNVSEPNKLGPLTKVSETVCTGKCK